MMKRYVKSSSDITLADAVPYEDRDGLKIFKTWNKNNGFTSTSLIVDTVGKRFQLVDGQVLRSGDLSDAKKISSVKKVRELAQDYKNKGFEEYDGYGSVQMSSSCSKSKNYVKSDVDMNNIQEASTAVLNSICKIRYYAESLYELCYTIAEKYYSKLFEMINEEWDGDYPYMYGKAENFKWYIAFPETFVDNSAYIEICFSVGKGAFDVLPVEWWDYEQESYIENNFEYIEDLEPAYTRFEDTIYIFKKNGFELDESQSDLDDIDGTAVFYNKETGELHVFDTWSKAEDYAYDHF